MPADFAHHRCLISQREERQAHWRRSPIKPLPSPNSRSFAPSLVRACFVTQSTRSCYDARIARSPPAAFRRLDQTETRASSRHYRSKMRVREHGPPSNPEHWPFQMTFPVTHSIPQQPLDAVSASRGGLIAAKNVLHQAVDEACCRERTLPCIASCDARQTHPQLRFSFAVTSIIPPATGLRGCCDNHCSSAARQGPGNVKSQEAW